jgi:uncharacterized protein (DUF2141 family)
VGGSKVIASAVARHPAPARNVLPLPISLLTNILPLSCSVMKTLPLAALLLGGFTLGAAPAPAPAVATETVKVIITNLASTRSVVRINFYDAPEKFLKEGQHALHLVVKPEGKTELTLPVELVPGEWAVALTQDLNGNEKMDKNFLGIPTEPYAFSNNIRPRVSAPTFQECKFRVSGPGKVVSIALKE